MIIPVSDSTRQDAIELAGVAPEHLHTVYPCIDPRFANDIEEDTLASFRQKYGVENGFLLYLGTLEPRKNITTLIEAYARLRTVYQRTEKLVLAGGKGWLYEAIFDRVRQLGLESEVIFPGYVADEEQSLWYHVAGAFVYPSLYEGFGLPVAEALAAGTPVVTSTVSSLPEAGAGIALCVEPQDVEAMTEALYRALTDQEYRQKCRMMASSVAEQFSARRMVEQTIAIYEQAAQFHAANNNFQRVSYVH
jgi:glycosyltransferase involved in cell wall biosynthesis